MRAAGLLILLIIICWLAVFGMFYLILITF